MHDILTQFLSDHLYKFALIMCVCVGALLAAMAVDLIFGIRKAKINGEATTSTGLKKTCDKARKYFTPYVALLSVDLIATCAGLPVPAFSMLWGIWCCLCEFASIREKAWQKAEIRKAERTMSIILENKGELAQTLLELIKQNEAEEEKKDNS